MKWLSFLKALLINPRSIGAVIPSSRYLAKSMSQCISITDNGFVLELGPGTGAITKGILKSGITPTQLVVLELSPEFANQLQKNYPGITVIQGNATHLSTLMKNKRFNTVISSLPLRSLPPSDCEKILTDIPTILSPNGKFIQYTYPIFGKEITYPDNYRLEKSFMEWRNIPPARVDMFKIT